jgi:hypothetical protein
MKQPIPVEVNGILFPSIRKAANHLGVSAKAVQQALRNGRDLSKLKPGPKKFQKGHKVNDKPVLIRGVEYPSRSIASEVLGIHKTTISMAAKRGVLDRVGLGLRGRPRLDDV